MLDKILAEIVNEALQHAAYDVGIELGRELKNFLKVSRGEAAWEELTHVQQTMFLGGDREKYEQIRQQIRSAISRSSRYQKDNSNQCRDDDRSIPRGPFYDYGKF